MRKLIMFFVIGFFAFGMAAGSVWGSEFDISGNFSIDWPDVPGETSGPVTVAEEILTVDREADLMGSVTYPRLKARNILYDPSVQIKSTSTIDIYFTNGAIKISSNIYMLLEDDKGDAAQAGVMTDFLPNSAGTGYDFIRIQFTGIDRNGDGDIEDAGEDTIKSDEILVLSETLDPSVAATSNGNFNYSSPTIIINKELTKLTNITIQVTEAHDDNANPSNQLRTGAEVIATVVEGLDTTLTTATSTIDAQDSRLKFVEEGNANEAIYKAKDDTDLTISTAMDLHVDEEVAEVGFELNGADDYILTLTRSDATGVKNVWWSGKTGKHTSGTTTWSKEGDFGIMDVPGQSMLDGEMDIEIHVTGVPAGYLQTGKWELTLKIDTDEVAGLDDQTELNGEYSHEWNINAMQVKIPYMVLNHTGYLSIIKIANESDADAEVQGDAIIWNVTDNPDNPENTSTWEGDIKIIPPTSITTLSEAELMAVFGLNDAKMYHVELTLSVVAPINKVHVAAFQKGPDGRTDVPVLYDVQNMDGRQWQ